MLLLGLSELIALPLEMSLPACALPWAAEAWLSCPCALFLISTDRSHRGGSRWNRWFARSRCVPALWGINSGCFCGPGADFRNGGAAGLERTAADCDGRVPRHQVCHRVDGWLKLPGSRQGPVAADSGATAAGNYTVAFRIMTCLMPIPALMGAALPRLFRTRENW